MLDGPPTSAPGDRRRGSRTRFTGVVRGVAKLIVSVQLKSELGGVDVFTSESIAQPGTLVVLANVPQAVLEAAVLAHVGNPLFGQVTPPVLP